MRIRVHIWSLLEAIKTSYWFAPAIMAAAAILLSFGMIELDYVFPRQWLAHVPWLYTGSAEGARSLLSTIASTMIGIAGVVFSINIVVMQLASTQFGPRLVRNFMRDTGNQVVLGTFVANFLYCLMVLRKVHGSGSDGASDFIPQLSMLMAVLLSAAGIGVLIYFVHHAAATIQAPNVIASVTHELHAAIDELYPESVTGHGDGQRIEDERRAQIPRDFDKNSRTVEPGRGGYVELIDLDALMSDARDHDLVLRIERRPGQYIQPKDAMIRVWPAERADEQLLSNLREAFTISDQRTVAQDAEFAVAQLVEIAVRALSPGINDPFTAMQCIDRIGEALSHLAGRVIPSPYRLDDSRRLRVITYPVRFCRIVEAALNPIRQYASTSLGVLLRMLEMIERVAPSLQREEDVVCLREHAQMIYDAGIAAAPASHDRRDLERRHAGVMKALSPRDRADSDAAGFSGKGD